MIKERKNNFTNLVPIVEPTHVFHEVVPKNISTTYNIELTAILYAVNQPVDPQLWNGNFYCKLHISYRLYLVILTNLF